jgi:hypothetical protein
VSNFGVAQPSDEAEIGATRFKWLLIMPKKATSIEKLEKELQTIFDPLPTMVVDIAGIGIDPQERSSPNAARPTVKDSTASLREQSLGVHKQGPNEI